MRKGEEKPALISFAIMIGIPLVLYVLQRVSILGAKIFFILVISAFIGMCIAGFLSDFLPEWKKNLRYILYFFLLSIPYFFLSAIANNYEHLSLGLYIFLLLAIYHIFEKQDEINEKRDEIDANRKRDELFIDLLLKDPDKTFQIINKVKIEKYSTNMQKMEEIEDYLLPIKEK